MLLRYRMSGMMCALWLSALLAPPSLLANDGPRENPDPKLYEGLEYRCIGPYRGGRAATVAGVEDDEDTYYMGACGGGVWKTTNAGVSWQPISDDFFKTGSVGAIAVAPSDSNVLYVGMGEEAIRGNFSHGDGIYKSIDAGKTWVHLGLEETRHIGRIRIHPDNPDVAYVAALGHASGPNSERGVFRTTDGGKSFERVHFVDEKTGCVDIAMDPSDPDRLYAGFWQVVRTPYSLESGGPGSGLFVSEDGGDTWQELTRGLPKGIKGKIGVSVCASNPNKVYAIIESKEGGVFVSNNRGKSFQVINTDNNLRQRAWYYSRIYADPIDENTVYVMNVQFLKSTDGGKTFSGIRVPHGDNHDLWISRNDNRRMINANDGGANVSFDGGRNWSAQDNQPTAQFYRVAVDNQFPYRVYGAQQDNSTLSVPSRTSSFGIRKEDNYSIGGGESGYIAPHPDDPNIVYAGSYGGYLTRYDHRTRTSRNIHVWPDNPMGWGAAELKYRFQWTFPIVISPHDHDKVYTAANCLFETTNEGQSWKKISPDLTRNDKSKQGPSGGPITGDNTGVEYYATIFTVAECPHQAGTIWVGSDDGLIHITRDGGKSWRQITPVDLPEWSMISIIEPSTHRPGTAFVAATRYKLDDYRPSLWRTDDYGETWREIVDGIDDQAFTRTVREDPDQSDLLYAGTETGIYVSFNGGGQWQELQLNLPRVPITDLAVKNRNLVVATQGRSFWILDDLHILHQLTPDLAQKAVHVFDPSPTYKMGGRSFRGASVGTNPPSGAVIHYYLSEKVEEMSFEFIDWNGEVVATIDKLPNEPGLNSYEWNMRYPGAVEVPGAVFWGGGTRGPTGSAGDYQVRCRFSESTLEKSFNVLPDPRFDVTEKDSQEQFKFLIAVRDRVSDAHRAVNKIRKIRAQVIAVRDHSKSHSTGSAIEERAEQLLESLRKVEDEIIQSKSKAPQDPLNYPIKLNNKIAALSGVVSRSPYRPTDQAWEVFEDLSAQLQVQIDNLEQVIQDDVPGFNRFVQQQSVPAIILDGEDKD